MNWRNFSVGFMYGLGLFALAFIIAVVFIWVMEILPTMIGRFETGVVLLICLALVVAVLAGVQMGHE